MQQKKGGAQEHVLVTIQDGGQGTACAATCAGAAGGIRCRSPPGRGRDCHGRPFLFWIATLSPLSSTSTLEDSSCEIPNSQSFSIYTARHAPDLALLNRYADTLPGVR